MNTNSLKQLLNNDDISFQKDLMEALKSTLRNHKLISNERRLTQIYEEINDYNKKIFNLIKEAKLLEADGSDAFSDDPESVGLDGENDNVEVVNVTNMTNLTGDEKPNNVDDVTYVPATEMPEETPIPEGLEDIFAEDYDAETDPLNVTDDADINDYTDNTSDSNDYEHRQERKIGVDSTNDNVEKVVVFDEI